MIEERALQADLVSGDLFRRHRLQLASDLGGGEAQETAVEVAALEAGGDADIGQDITRDVVVQARAPREGRIRLALA